MGHSAVRRRLLAIIHTVVTHYCSYPKPVVLEDPASSFGLRGPVHLKLPPLLDRLFVPPERERQYLSRLGDAFKPLDGDKAIHPLEPGQERGSDIQILLLSAIIR